MKQTLSVTNISFFDEQPLKQRTNGPLLMRKSKQQRFSTPVKFLTPLSKNTVLTQSTTTIQQQSFVNVVSSEELDFEQLIDNANIQPLKFEAPKSIRGPKKLKINIEQIQEDTGSVNTILVSRLRQLKINQTPKFESKLNLFSSELRAPQQDSSSESEESHPMFKSHSAYSLSLITGMTDEDVQQVSKYEMSRLRKAM